MLVKPEVVLGKERLRDFSFRKGYVNLNHGSFGTCPKVVWDAMDRYRAEIEEAPDVFLRLDFAKRLSVVRKHIGEIVNADAEDIVFVANATTGVNTVLRSLKFARGQGVLYFSTIYGSCGNTVEFLVDQSDGDIFSHVIPLTYPSSDAKILADFEHALKTVKNLKIAVFDHVISLPGVKMPWIEMTKLCRKYDVLSLVDGAHGIGLAPLDLKAVDPDFFISNCHKWLHCMRGNAILYTAKRAQTMIHSMPIGHGYVPKAKSKAANGKTQNENVQSAYQLEFEWMATLDLSSILAMEDAILYRKAIGEDKIIAYTTNLAVKGAAAIAHILGTEVMNVETPVAMMNVRLPIDAKTDELVMAPRARGDWFFRTCKDEFNMAFSPFVHNGHWWGRFSGQIYLELEDFEYGGKVIKELCDRIAAEHKAMGKISKEGAHGSELGQLEAQFGQHGLADTTV